MVLCDSVPIALRGIQEELRNQNAGGGRIKKVWTGREITADFAGAAAKGAATKIGAVITGPRLKPMWAAEQMEQS